MNEVPPPRVLIVDDDRPIRNLLASICRRIGFSCDTAADGGEALAKMRSASFDLIVLDLMMPKVSGYEVIEQLRAVPAPPVVIVLTAQGARQTARLEAEKWIHTVMTKPFDLDALENVLLEAGRRSKADPSRPSTIDPETDR